MSKKFTPVMSYVTENGTLRMVAHNDTTYRAAEWTGKCWSVYFWVMLGPWPLWSDNKNVESEAEAVKLVAEGFNANVV